VSMVTSSLPDPSPKLVVPFTLKLPFVSILPLSEMVTPVEP